MAEVGEAAQAAYAKLCDEICAFVSCSPEGFRNDEVARSLGLETHFNGGQRNYLTFAALTTLVQKGRLVRHKSGGRVNYRRV